jgi:predicted aldo/keto reductase-like oxidoreductase
VEARKSGLIQAVGVSTHSVEVVREVCRMDEVDVVHPIVNYKGLGIIDGTIDDMLGAIQMAHECGKGIYSMKPLGGGNLSRNYRDCFEFVLNNKFIHSVAVGMQNEEEIYANIAIFEGRVPDEKTNNYLINRNKKLHIDDWCEGCGKCINACKNSALEFKDGKAHVIGEKCVLCGYCSAYCPDFCIKII